VDEFCADARTLYLKSMPDEDLKRMLKHLQKDVDSGKLGPSGKEELRPLCAEELAEAIQQAERRRDRVLTRLRDCCNQLEHAQLPCIKATLKKRINRLKERLTIYKDDLRILRLTKPHNTGGDWRHNPISYP
jgi:hypothetical protein